MRETFLAMCVLAVAALVLQQGPPAQGEPYRTPVRNAIFGPRETCADGKCQRVQSTAVVAAPSVVATPDPVVSPVVAPPVVSPPVVIHHTPAPLPLPAPVFASPVIHGANYEYGPDGRLYLEGSAPVRVAGPVRRVFRCWRCR